MSAQPTGARGARLRRAIEDDILASRDRPCPAVNGAGEGIRTLDPDLGKVVLYP